MKFFSSFLLVFVSGQAAGSSCRTVPFEGKCQEGCYFEGNLFNSDGTRPCTPVGLGYYSPAQDNHRYPCIFGTYSDSEMAGHCRSCPAGTQSAGVGSTECQLCPSASYTTLSKSVFCSPCDPEYYNGDGSNSIEVWDGKVYCSFIMTPDAYDSPEPLSTEPPTSAIENPATILAKSGTNGRDSVDEDDMCFPTEYIWHGKCTGCASAGRATMQPIWIGLLVGGVISVLSELPEKSVVWMGLEYLQLVHFLGFISDIHPVHEHIHRWILSIFALDLDAGFSWQCMLELSASVDQLFILSFPLMAAASICVLSRRIPTVPAGRWIVTGFHLGHFKFVLTSMEALYCDRVDWYCHDSIFSTVVGILGFTVYGLGGPVWIVWQRYSHSSSHGHEPTWSHYLGFRNCWWWPGFWIVRRTLLASLPMALPDHQPWLLIILLVLLMITELLQRFALPTDKQDGSQGNKWFRVSTVDAVLQASLISLAGVEFLSVALPPEALRADGLTIAIFFLGILLFTIVYWLTTLVSEHLHGRQHHKSYIQEVDSYAQDEKSRTSTSTSSSAHQSQMNSSIGSALPPPPPSIANSDEKLVQHRPSVVPVPCLGDDMDNDAIHEEGSFLEWTRRSDNNVDTKSKHRSYFSASESFDPAFSSELDDTSTLTDTNSYVHIMPYKYEPDTTSTIVSSILGSSEDGSPMIFADDEDSPLEYRVSWRRRNSKEDENDNDDVNEDTSEVWIDQETGRPVVNKEAGEWADASTGLPIRP